MPGNPKQKITLTPSLYAHLHTYAQANQLSISEVCRRGIAQFLNHTPVSTENIRPGRYPDRKSYKLAKQSHDRARYLRKKAISDP